MGYFPIQSSDKSTAPANTWKDLGVVGLAKLCLEIMETMT